MKAQIQVVLHFRHCVHKLQPTQVDKGGRGWLAPLQMHLGRFPQHKDLQDKHQTSSLPRLELCGMSEGKMGVTLGQGAQSLRKSPNCREDSSQFHSFFLCACAEAWGTKYVSLTLTLKGKKSLILWSMHTN